MLLRFVWLDLYGCVKTPSSGQSGLSSCLSTCPLQGGTVPAKTSQIPKHGRRTSAVPWIPCLTSVSCRSTAGREAAMLTESTGWCPAHKHTDAGEVSDAFVMCSSLRRWTCPDTWQTSRDAAVLSCPLSGLRFFSRPRERQTSLGDEVYTAHTWQPTTTRPTSDTAQKVEAPTEDTFGSTQTHGEKPVVESFIRRFFWLLHQYPRKDGSFCCCAGMWEAKPEDLEQSEAVFKVSDPFMYCPTD